MKKGQYYKVQDKSGFWMVGRCDEEPITDPNRCLATYYTIHGELLKRSSWCFQDTSRSYQKASPEEIGLLIRKCAEQGIFLEPNYEIF